MARFKQGYVLEPESFWRPAYRISPFNTLYVKRNLELVKQGLIDKNIIEQFFGPCFIPCQNGKQAIHFALQQYGLERDDEIWIITTSGNTYISNCVTKEIETFCRWSMQRSRRTKLIFLNHEFGFCYKEHEELKKLGLPIIEDRALSFASQDDAKATGTIGDMVIYSLPKFFPVNFGGVLQFNNETFYSRELQSDDDLRFMFNCLMSHYLREVNTIAAKRRENFSYLKRLFEQMQFGPRFTPTAHEVPGVFMFKTKNIKLDRIKTQFQANGIEASVFYGEEAFFIPVHQELSTEDMDFFFLLATDFIEHGNQ